jgi:N-acyl-D-aspartate/D-glutamate deacylase
VRADLAIAGERIAAVGPAEGSLEADAGRTIDATGCIVAPGFIDIHSHSDYTLLVDPRAVSAIHQGVTTEVVGNCGFGCAPVRDAALAAGSIYGFDGSIAPAWPRTGAWLDALAARRPAVNVLALVPNGQLRRAVVGLADRPARPDEVAAMARLLAEGLDDGAIGYSTGLEYPAESGAGPEEVTTLARVAAGRGGIYATHTRARDAGALAAIEEALATARATGVRLQVSHLIPRRTAGGELEGALGLVEGAVAEGLDVHFDMHTRPFGTTMLSTLIPPWASEGGPDALRARLADPAERRRMRGYRSIIGGLGDWSRVVLLDLAPFPQYARRSLAEVGAERGQDPHDAALELLAAEPPGGPPFMVILHCYTPDQQAAVFGHPMCMPASDATTLAPDGPLGRSAFHGAYSWAAWFFRFMVRERRLLTPAEAVHRMCGMPADVLGLADRGRLAAGAMADVVVFDPERFGERASVFEPNRLAEGMAHVFVNGTATLAAGLPTGARAGAVLRGVRPTVSR